MQSTQPSSFVKRASLTGNVARALIVATLASALLAGLAGCGQRGPLYYPDKENPDRRR